MLRSLFTPTLCLVFAVGLSLSAAEEVTGLSVNDSPDPMKTSASISGEFRFSGTGPDVDSPGVIQSSRLKMTVTLSGAAGIVRALTASISAAREPGDPAETTKTVTA